MHYYLVKMSVNDKIDKYTNIDTYYNNNNDVKQIPFPYKISQVDYETNKELLNYFKGILFSFITIFSIIFKFGALIGLTLVTLKVSSVTNVKIIHAHIILNSFPTKY